VRIRVESKMNRMTFLGAVILCTILSTIDVPNCFAQQVCWNGSQAAAAPAGHSGEANKIVQGHQSARRTWTKAGVHRDFLRPGKKITVGHGSGPIKQIQFVRRSHPAVYRGEVASRTHSQPIHHDHKIVADTDSQTVISADSWRKRRGTGRFPKEQTIYDPR